MGSMLPYIAYMDPRGYDYFKNLKKKIENDVSSL